MPTGIYKRTEKHIEIARKHLELARRKIVNKKHSEETRKKMSESHKGIKVQPEQRLKISEGLKKAYKEGKRKPYWLGKKQSDEHIAIRTNKIKGLIRTNEQIKNYSIAQKRRYTEHPEQIKRNEENPNWKGNKVKHCALHEWVRRYKKNKGLCEICNKERKLDVANISGKYKRDLDDYKFLCRSCHTKMDRKRPKEIKDQIKRYMNGDDINEVMDKTMYGFTTIKTNNKERQGINNNINDC